MKVLSIKNPFSYLICYGIKDVENRTWQTDYRGELLIHSSGKSIINMDPKFFPEKINKELDKLIENTDNPEEAKKLIEIEEFKKIIDLDSLAYDYFLKNKKSFFQTQCIIGKVELVDVVKNSESIWADKNCYHWIFKNPVMFDKPIENLRGKLNIWEYKI